MNLTIDIDLTGTMTNSIDSGGITYDNVLISGELYHELRKDTSEFLA